MNRTKPKPSQWELQRWDLPPEHLLNREPRLRGLENNPVFRALVWLRRRGSSGDVKPLTTPAFRGRLHPFVVAWMGIPQYILAEFLQTGVPPRDYVTGRWGMAVRTKAYYARRYGLFSVAIFLLFLMTGFLTAHPEIGGGNFYVFILFGFGLFPLLLYIWGMTGAMLYLSPVCLHFQRNRLRGARRLLQAHRSQGSLVRTIVLDWLAATVVGILVAALAIGGLIVILTFLVLLLHKDSGTLLTMAFPLMGLFSAVAGLLAGLVWGRRCQKRSDANFKELLSDTAYLLHWLNEHLFEDTQPSVKR